MNDEIEDLLNRPPHEFKGKTCSYGHIKHPRGGHYEFCITPEATQLSDLDELIEKTVDAINGEERPPAFKMNTYRVRVIDHRKDYLLRVKLEENKRIIIGGRHLTVNVGDERGDEQTYNLLVRADRDLLN